MNIENFSSNNYTAPAVELMGRGRPKNWIARRSRGQKTILSAAANIATGGAASMFQRQRRRSAPAAGNFRPGRSGMFSARPRPAGQAAPDLSGMYWPIAQRDVPDVELMGRGRLKKFVKKVKKSMPKGKGGRILAAVATGGASGLFTKKKTKAGRAIQAIATGGASAAARGIAKRGGGKAIGRTVAAIATGGASVLFQKNKAGRIARGFATGGASALFQKNKAGTISRKVAGYMFAPVTMSTVNLVKKVKAAKKVKAEQAAAVVEQQQAAATEAAAAEAAAEMSPETKTKKALPWIIGGAAVAAIPFFLGD